MVLIKEKKLGKTHLLALRHIKGKKASLAVDVRRSKTSLLKFPLLPRQDYSSVDGALNCRAGGRGFDSWDLPGPDRYRTGTLSEKLEMGVMRLPNNGQTFPWLG